MNQAGETYVLTQDISAPGTAFTIAASDVILDLGGHTVAYNTAPSSVPVYGVYVNVLRSRVTVRNGTLLQGAGGSARSPAVFIYGGTATGGHELHHLVIGVRGDQTHGIDAGFAGYTFNNSKIHHSYVQVTGGVPADCSSGGPAGISLQASASGGAQVHDNIVVESHVGISAAGVGSESGSNPSRIHRNLIQHRRRAGCKGPYGIGVQGISHGVEVDANQIVSDDGRGIIVAGWGQGSAAGASGNSVHDNRIDVGYSTLATGGFYPENSVYGIRDRYHAGDNRFENNVVLVTNDVTDPGNDHVRGFYIGSDASDADMRGIVARGNTVFARRGQGSGTIRAFHFDYADEVTIDANRYLTAGEVRNTGNVTALTFTNNAPLDVLASSALAAPTGLAVARCLNSYVLTWNTNPEADVFEYAVYRDGAKLPISPRGGTFYVDVGAALPGPHSYAVSALALSGLGGPRSAEASTAAAGVCLGAIVSDTTPPAAPSNLMVQ
ncbi:MAG: hypothetical protein A2150_07755 [Candidatus Muproteobacteria bacterium RBG_16_64_11]|uniref:Right handed beta helix domain-containing protein n=1 Tax=Candidatus Muproteobacteria bacterium RBG_16_64_11 TaxID=1817758 RepID=A0A1F6TF94_9PROT|nr:MAG: hypothetical protein A2150_07755 [Candidatus Muproteobacteria bacterium RBG_16_64_11]